jgi:hypothetical protein
MTHAQRRLLTHVRDWWDGQLDGRAEAELQTELYAAAYDAVMGAVIRRGWLTRQGELTEAGRSALTN